jgi:glucose-1-phosphate thymidylyltransferase
MKGIILHGGAGTRLRPLTFSGPKQLIPVANKPISQYVLEDLRDAGIRDVAIVLGETFPELVQQHYGDGNRFNVRITYIFQGKPLGIAHALSLCRDFVGGDRFILYLGDNLLQHGVRGYLERFVREDFDVQVLLKAVDDPTKFGVARFEGERLAGFVEKPKVPPSKYALVGVYFFKPTVFDVLRDLKPSWRGELEITDALQLMLERGYHIGYSFVEGWWLDTGKKDDILYANSLILDEHARRSVQGEIVESRVEGRVEVGEDSRLVKSVVRGPTVIGKGCIIEGSYIGPYTSVGDNSKILNSSIEYSIIMSGAVVEGVERLEESLVGKNAKVLKNTVRNSIKLHVGDYSEIEL